MIKYFLAKKIEEGWTQERIAEKVGIRQSAVSKYANGKPCTVETLKKIADAFNVTTDEVLSRDAPQPPNRSNSLTDHKPLSQKEL